MRRKLRIMFGLLILFGCGPTLAESIHNHDRRPQTSSDSHQVHKQEQYDHPIEADGHDAHHNVHWTVPADAARRQSPIAPTPDSIARGKRLFEESCMKCHGSSGSGDGPMAQYLCATPSNLARMAPRQPEGDLAWKIANGRGLMPAWRDVYNEEDIWNIVHYVQTLGERS